MSTAQHLKIQALLSAEMSPLRDELLELGFAALASVPLATLTAPGKLAKVVAAALTQENAERIARRHVVPGIERVTAGFRGRDEKVRGALHAAAEQRLRAIVASGQGPRFGWLQGAIDPDDFRQLLAPVVQQVLVQFASKLPIPGLGGQGGGGSAGAAGGLGGLVGMLGKQVQKSAGTLADVGKSVFAGIGGEFERRMQAIARDFSHTATAEFRSALLARMKSAEGALVVARIRDRVVEHVLEARLDDVVRDFMHLPVAEIAQLTTEVLGQLPSQPLFHELLEGEIAGVLAELEQRSLADMLHEAGLWDAARVEIVQAVEPGLKRMVAGVEFGAWLERLLAASQLP